MTAATSITVRVPLKIRRRPGRKTVVTPMVEEGADAAIPTRADPALLKALARAHRWQRLLDAGHYESITELAAAENVDRGYLGRILQLTMLAPFIVDAILAGRCSVSVGMPALIKRLTPIWEEQAHVIRPD